MRTYPEAFLTCVHVKYLVHISNDSAAAKILEFLATPY